MREIRGRLARWTLGAAGVALLLGLGWSLCRRGIVLSDEGYLLLQSLDMTRGRVLYRDLDAFVTPGIWLSLSALFRLVEPSVLASRLIAFVVWLATAGLSWRIVRRLCGPGWALGALAAFVAGSIWAFPAWTFSFYSPPAVLFGLVALECLLAWREREAARTLVALGAALGLSILFKQNYGVLACLGALAGLAAIRVEAGAAPRRLAAEIAPRLLPIGLGGLVVALPVAGWLAAQGALGDAFDALALRPFREFLGSHDIPYLWPHALFASEGMSGTERLTYASQAYNRTGIDLLRQPLVRRIIELLHVWLFSVPLLLFAAAGWLLVARRRHGRPLDGGLAATLAMAGAFWLGSFPRADYNHLMNVYQPMLVLAAVVAQRLAMLAPERPRLVRATLGAGTALACLYAGLAATWYLELRSELVTPAPGERGGVLLDPLTSQLLGFEVAEIQQRSRPGEPVLTLPGLSMLNFLAERPTPARHYNFYAVHVASDGGAGAVEAIERQGVRLVVAEYRDFFSERRRLREYAPVLTNHLRRHFAPVFAIGVEQRLFLERREEPLPDVAVVSVLDDCDVPPEPMGPRRIARNLLFDSLYHTLPRERPARSGKVTRCRVRVPASGGTLSFGLGYRQPIRIEPSTGLAAQVLVRRASEPDGEVELLMNELIPMQPSLGFGAAVAVPHRLDLSPWAGEEILVMFQNAFIGRVSMNPLDPFGFAAIWDDPLLEVERNGGG